MQVKPNGMLISYSPDRWSRRTSATSKTLHKSQPHAKPVAEYMGEKKGRHFTDEQLTEMYRCMQDTLDGHYELTEKQ